MWIEIVLELCRYAEQQRAMEATCQRFNDANYAGVTVACSVCASHMSHNSSYVIVKVLVKPNASVVFTLKRPMSVRPGQVIEGIDSQR